MYEAKFKLKHTGCWTCGLSKFKSSFCTHMTVSLTKDFVQDITEVYLVNKKEASEIKEYFRNNNIINKWSILEESEKKMSLQIFTDTSKIKSVVHTILKNKCFVAKKVFVENGCEIWTIASSDKTSIKNALEELKGLGELTLLRLSKSTFDGFNLSEQQEIVLRRAISSGYYMWPRKISAKELAEKIGLRKSTVLEHLRKAEIKIICREFGI